LGGGKKRGGKPAGASADVCVTQLYLTPAEVQTQQGEFSPHRRHDQVTSAHVLANARAARASGVIVTAGATGMPVMDVPTAAHAAAASTIAAEFWRRNRPRHHPEAASHGVSEYAEQPGCAARAFRRGDEREAAGEREQAD